MLWEKLGSSAVKCNLCGWRCVIQAGRRGRCMVRENQGGVLQTLVYGKAASYAVDPIEKKPLYHFHPGSTALSVATVGCNFRCVFCDNWSISQETHISGEEMPPEQLVHLAKSMGCRSISYTYTEPTIFFEYAYDTARLAHKEGILNTFVTNGYMTPEAVKTIDGYLDAATIDFKGSGDPDFYKKFCGTLDVAPVFDALKAMKKEGIFIEITNLIVPEGGDSKEAFSKLVNWIVGELGPDIPFHILRFFSSYKYTGPDSTSLSGLVELWNLAKSLGLKYVYLGNVMDPRYGNTNCPRCGRAVIERVGMGVASTNLKGDRCAFCGEKLNVIV
jgi:pyruvate formate lyase activating enzyme